MGYTYLSITDLKNRARKIARDENLSRHAALGLAAVRGGYSNFANALKHLPTEATPSRHIVEIHQRWRDRDSRTFGTSRVSVTLATRLTELLKPHQLVEYIGACAIENETTLRSGLSMRDRKDSIGDLTKLARALQFIDATGLKPSRARKCYPKGEWNNRPPIADHDSCWFDPEARVHVLVTEPYPGRASSHCEEQRAWEQRHGWQTLQTNWGSMYGHGTEFYLLCPAEYGERLKQKIASVERAGAAVQEEAVDASDEHVMRTAA